MIIKVQKIDNESNTDNPSVLYGIVAENINTETFNLFRKEPIFDEELASNMLIGGKTIVKYGPKAIRGEEVMTAIDNEEVVYHYLFLGDFIFEIINNIEVN